MGPGGSPFRRKGGRPKPTYPNRDTRAQGAFGDLVSAHGTLDKERLSQLGGKPAFSAAT